MSVTSVFSPAEMQRLQNSRALLLVSGGPDSVYLFQHFLDWQNNSDGEFGVLHFNHHLRGEDADQDARFVADLCQKNSIPVQIVDLSPPPAGNLQNWARQKRYEYACGYAAKHHFNLIVTAHHADDNLETVVMKKNRGTGLRGLSGIRRWQKQNGYHLFRPLLNVSKADILQYLKNRNLAFRTDASNRLEKYYRNRVRAALAKNPLPQSCQDHVTFLSAIDNYFSARSNCMKSRHHFLPQTQWQSLAPEMQFRVLSAQAKQHGWHQEWQTLHFQTLQNTPSQISNGNLTILHDQNGFWFVTEKTKSLWQNARILRAPGHFIMAGHKFNLFIEENDFKYLKNNGIYISKKLKFPLHLGLASTSETFRSFAQSSAKPLSAFFQNQGIGPHTRRFWPVLKNRQNEIVAVPGLDVAEAWRVDPQDTWRYRLTGPQSLIGSSGPTF